MTIEEDDLIHNWPKAIAFELPAGCDARFGIAFVGLSGYEPIQHPNVTLDILDDRLLQLYRARRPTPEERTAAARNAIFGWFGVQAHPDFYKAKVRR